MWECEWWSLYKTDASVRSQLRENFPYKRPFSEEQLLQAIIDRKLFGYIQCDIEVPEHLGRFFSNFPPIFKNTKVGKEDNGNLTREYAEKETVMAQPSRMLIPSFHLTNGTLKTSLLVFYWKLGLVWKKFHRFVRYLPKECCNIFVQSAVNAGRQRD